MYHKQIEPTRVVPLHGLRDGKAEGLRDGMIQRGWVGRRLLIETVDTTFHAWMGTHRLSAAIRAGLATVPCLVLLEEDLAPLSHLGFRRTRCCWWHSLHSIWNYRFEDLKATLLRRIGLSEAADLIIEDWRESR